MIESVWAGSHERAGGFFPVVYDELKRLAAARLAGERSGHSLYATALVHEAYSRLGETTFADRSGFVRSRRHAADPGRPRAYARSWLATALGPGR
jgi:hypothetical protein